MIKALIVEDSGLMRIKISDVLRSEGIRVVATANNGADGFKAIQAKQPDVVITDMVMPKYDGLYLVKKVMKENPLPVIILSALERKNDQVFEALELGAFDFIDKPKSTRTTAANKSLVKLVKAAANVKGPHFNNGAAMRNNLAHTFDQQLNYDLVVIGASTGGPAAIECLLKGLPANFPVPIVIAQHMPTRFLQSFAERLNMYTNLKVKLAEPGETLKVNHIYVCVGEDNTEITRNLSNGHPQFGFSKRRYKEFNDPSVDCLFRSAAEVFGKRAIAVILTGMGKDGTQGLKELKLSGGISIAQNEGSCVVFGMPKAAVEARLVDYTLDIKEMAGFITSCFS